MGLFFCTLKNEDLNNMKEVKTFEAKIYVGLRPSYGEDMYNDVMVKRICQDYCNNESLCVTTTPTSFHYKDGWEHGMIIGLINYPRFPSSKEKILDNAMKLGYLLMNQLKQNRVTIVTTDATIMLEADDEIG